MTLEPLVRDLSNLKVSELVTLSRRLETEWGVSLQTIQPPATVNESPSTTEPVEAQTAFTATLVEIGPRKIEVIKVVREILPHLTLVDAKKTVESYPFDVVSDTERDEADRVAERLQAVGAVVSVH